MKGHKRMRIKIKQPNKKTVLYVFSGTGNSLAVANQLAENLKNTEIIPIKKSTLHKPVEDTVKKVGFVFPIYYGQLPRLVYEFIDTMNLNKDTYYFAIATYGGIGTGAISVLTDFLKRKKIKLAYGNAVKVVRNYILIYNPPSENEKAFKKADEKIKIIANDVKSDLVFNPRRFRLKANTLYKNIEKLDEGFISDHLCISCGKCAAVCPVANIVIDQGKPSWQHECERCMACISWCPTGAIQYGHKTLKRNPYHHPKVTLEAMIEHNKV